MKVYVKVLSGTVVCLRVGEHRRIDSVKNQIMEKLRVPLHSKARLYCANSSTGELELMEGDRTMRKYGVRPGVTLYLGMTITVRVRKITDEGSALIHINTWDSIGEVKSKVHERLGILPVEQRLILGGKCVEDDDDVKDYYIKNNDEIYVIRRVSRYNLCIKDSCRGCDLSVVVEASYTIRRVKEMIEEAEGIPVEHQQLKFCNGILDDSKTLKDCNIRWGNKLVLDVCKQQKSSQVFVRTLSGKTITVDIGASETIESVKSTIECREGIPSDQQKLMFSGRQLRDGTLSENGVVRDATLNLALCMSGGGCMEIYIKTTTGNTITVQIEATNTVAELKEKIFEEHGIPPDRQRLIFSGQELEDSQTLAEYNIQGTTTLHLVVRRPRGEGATVCLTLITHTGKEICLNVRLGESVKSVISAIKEIEGIPNYCLQLFYNGELLGHQKLLSDCGFDSHPRRKHVVYLKFKGQIQVFIKTQSSSKISAVKKADNKLSLRVAKEMKVSALKHIIEHREKIPVYFQTLLYGGKVMDDCSVLEDYDIRDKCILHLWPERLHHMQLAITVETPSESLTLQALDLDTKILKVKERSQYIMHENADSTVVKHCLYYGSIPLENDKSLQDYMITDGSKLLLLPPREFPVFVHTTIGDSFTKHFIGVQTTDTIKEVKNRILVIAKVPLHHSLYLASIHLDDDRTVGEYRITPSCILHSVCPDEIPIQIKTRLTTIALGVTPSKSVRTIMEKIHRSPEIGVPESKQRLLFHQQLLSGKVMGQRKRIQDVHISAGNTLNLVVTPEELDVYIYTPRGSTLTLVCLGSDTILDVKDAIEEVEGIPVENQIFPFGADDRTLTQEKIKPGAHLDVGYLSVVPAKASSDQQEMYERVIIQQNKKELEQELESARAQEYMFEMQLDSASNYMETKISRFEDNLAQYRDKIAVLEKEKQALQQKLTHQAEKMKSLTEKLKNTKEGVAIEDTDSQVQTVTAPRSVAMPLPQDSGFYGLYRVFTYSGKEIHLKCEDYGINLHFPEHHMAKEVRVTVMSLNISCDDCSLPDGAELVSSVYRIEVSEQLPSPVVVEIQHCVRLSDSDEASRLSFVHSNSDRDPLYQFKTLEGGRFSAHTRYGKIELTHFSYIGIVDFLWSLFNLAPSFVYSTNVFSKQTNPSRYDVHVVVTRNLANIITHLKRDTDYSNWNDIGEQEVDFGHEDFIAVEVTEDNGKESTKGWKATVTQKPAKIKKGNVNTYDTGMSIPYIPLRVRWENEHRMPVRADLTIALTGTLEPVSFLFECDPQLYTPSISYDGSDIIMTSPRGSLGSQVFCPLDKPIFDERVDTIKLSLIRFSDGAGQLQELRIRKQLLPKWRELAPHLGFDYASIEAFSQSQTSVDDMLSEWLRTDTNSTWRTLITKMSDAGLYVLANVLKDALCCMI